LPFHSQLDAAQELVDHDEHHQSHDHVLHDDVNGFGDLNDPESHALFYSNPGLEEEDNNGGTCDDATDNENEASDLEDVYNDDGSHDPVPYDSDEDNVMADGDSVFPARADADSCFKMPSKPPDVYDFSSDNSVSAREWVEQWYQWTTSLTSESPDFHPSGLPDEVSLLQSYLNDPNYKPGWNVISQSERAEISMMNRLNNIPGCPLYAYDAVRDWGKESLWDDDEDSNSNHLIQRMRSREQVLKSSVERAHTAGMSPITTRVQLPGCGKSVYLTHMSYLGNFYHQLTDQDLVNDNTLLLNGKTPTDDPILEDDYVVDDFNTGTRYVNAWTNMKKTPIDFPLGEVFFVDKANLDMNGRLAFEPVMHTNSLINCSARYKSSAWHNLGCLPQLKGLGHCDYEDKLNDYHLCLGVILDDYIKLQTTKAGILWPLAYGDKLFMVRFRPYVLTVLGDTPGQNEMTGKMTKCNRLCRYCIIEKEDLSKPWVESELMTVEKQSRIQASETLRQEYCYKKVNVIWNECDFGNDPHGIHCNVPAETLHAVEKGIDLRTNEVVLATPSLSAAARKRDKKAHREYVASVLECDQPKQVPYKNPEAPTQDELLKNGVFGGAMGNMVNAISVVLGQQLSHQSDRNICRLYFPQGIMSRCKTTASEQQGFTLLMALILASTWSLKDNGLRDRLGDKRTGSYIKILEHIIMLEEVLKSHPGKTDTPLLASDIPALVLYTQMVLCLITDSMARNTGDGFNLIKFHLIMHMVRQGILMYGLPRNVSGCPGESQFKKNFKLPGKKTQMRSKTFDEQCCTRHYENVTITTCQQIVDRIERDKRDAEDSVHLEEHFGRVLSSQHQSRKVRTGKLLSENIYSVLQTRLSKSSTEEYAVDIVFKGKYETARAVKFPECSRSDGHLIGADGKAAGSVHILGLRNENESFSAVTDFLSPIIEANKDLRVDVYTCLKVPKTPYQEEDTLYRADPFCSIGHKPRHDWTLVQWDVDDGEPEQVPGQILGFLDVDEDLMHAFNRSPNEDYCIRYPGKYAMVYSMKSEIPGLMDPTVTVLDSAHLIQSNSVLFFWGEREVEGEDGNLVIRLVDVECFVRPLIVIPDFDPTFKVNVKGVNIEKWIRSKSRNNAFIVIRPRDLWHSTFIELAKEHYAKETSKKRRKGGTA
jgi:hypothetical protein